MNTIQDILDDLREFERSPQNAGFELRLDLADIILRHLDGQKWTQARLAETAGMKDAYLTRVIHSAQNCTFDVAGRILHALGVQARLVETPVQAPVLGFSEGMTNGQEKTTIATAYARKSNESGVICKIGTADRTRQFRSAEVAACCQ